MNFHCNAPARCLPRCLTLDRCAAFAVAIHEQVGRFVQPHAMQISMRDFRLEQPPDDRRDVFARRNLPREFRHFIIEKAMIHPVAHFALQNFLEFLQVQHHSRGRVRLARHGHFEHIVVPVPMRVIALPKDAPVLLGRKRRVVIQMRRRKLDFACQIDHSANETASN